MFSLATVRKAAEALPECDHVLSCTCQTEQLPAVQWLQYFLLGRFKERHKHRHDALHKCIFKKNRAIREAEALKWLWPHAGPQQQHLSRVVTRASGSLSGSKQLGTWWPRVSHCLKSTVARAGEDGYPGWKEIRCSQASGCCCSRAFCPGKGLTPTWGGPGGGGGCCKMSRRVVRRGGGCPPGDNSHGISGS